MLCPAQRLGPIVGNRVSARFVVAFLSLAKLTAVFALIKPRLPLPSASMNVANRVFVPIVENASLVQEKPLVKSAMTDNMLYIFDIRLLDCFLAKNEGPKGFALDAEKSRFLPTPFANTVVLPID